MLNFNAKTFNPEILYAFDVKSTGPTSGKNHYHDFFELSIILEGESHYVINGEHYLLKAGTLLLFNPGVEHFEFLTEGTGNRQLHIGIRHFTIDRFPRDHFPFETTIVQLSDYHEAFFRTCHEIVQERHDAKSGYDVILKSLVLKLMVYILRDKGTDSLESNNLLLTKEEQKRQSLVDEIKQYIELNYMKDLSLNQIARDLYSSPATISRIFKEQLDDTPINYLIRYRLEKAKSIIENTDDVNVTEVAHLIGYEDAYYFSKLFKKYYGSSPTNYTRKEKPF